MLSRVVAVCVVGGRSSRRLSSRLWLGWEGVPVGCRPLCVEAVKDDGEELGVEDVVVGEGPAVEAGDIVHVHYSAMSADDDKVKESTWRTGTPAVFTLGDGAVIPGLDAGVEGMAVGGRRLLRVPPALGYGRFSNPPNLTLLYEVDLVGVGEDGDSPSFWGKLKAMFGGGSTM